MQTASPWVIYRPAPSDRRNHPGAMRRTRRLPHRPDVVVISSDRAAAGIEAQLAREGLVVERVPTGSTGSAIATRIVDHAPRAVIMEVSADDKHAWEVPLALGRTVGRSIPVIVVAPGPWGEAVGRCLLAGVRTVVRQGERDQLSETMARATTTTPLDSTLAALRLATLRKVVSGDADPAATENSVQLTRLERPPTPVSRRSRIRLDELGVAQRRLVQGLVAGRTPREIAAASGVSLQAVHGAQRRLANRLGVTTRQLADEVRRRFATRAAAPTTG